MHPDLATEIAKTQKDPIVRGDWLVNANSTVFARYTYTKQDSFAGGLQPLQGTGNNSASTNAVLHWTKVLGASKVNDLGVSYSRPNWAYTRPTTLPDSTAVISAWMASIASQKRSSSALDSLSVGSIMSEPGTISGNAVV